MTNAKSIGTIFALLAVVAAAALFAIAPDALAQAAGHADTGFSCHGGVATGHLYSSGAQCPTQLSFDHIFSFFVCNMEQLSSNLMGAMYCGMVDRLTPMVSAALVIAVLAFGTGFTIGVIPATAREFQKFMIKVAFVWAFATQSDLLISYGYRFLVEGAREGIGIALSGLNNATPGTNTVAVYNNLDGFLAKVMHFATDYVGVHWQSDSSGNVTSNPCQNAVFAVLAIMAIAFPPLFYLSLLIIGKVALTFVRAVFGYIYAIVGIAFLLTLSPFFLSFYLFQVTRPYFDKWLGYMISFALQMVIVFAFLTFIVSIDVKNLTDSFTQIIVPVQETQETTAFRAPWRYCTLCEFEVFTADHDSGTTTVVPPEQYGSVLGTGHLRCKHNPNYQAGAMGANGADYIPIRALSMAMPTDNSGKAKSTAPDLNVQNTLFQFAGTALLSLVVLAYIIDGILRFLPYFAQRLAGGLAPYAPQLGGGINTSGVPVTDIPGLRYDVGSQQYTGFFGSFERGFYSGFAGGDGSSVTRGFRGLQQGFTTAFRGKEGRNADGTTSYGDDTDPGMGGLFRRFLTNPLNESSE